VPVRRTICVAVLGLLGFALMSTPASASHRFPFRWEDPRPIRVIDSTKNGWSKSIRRAVRLWSRARYVRLKIVRRQRMAGKRCPPTQGFIRICSHNSFGAVTTNYPLGRRIFSSIVQLPQREHGMTLLGRKLSCHELGHAIGLNHYRPPRSGRSCLSFPTNDITPSRHDYSMLARMYRPR
jgi:hypothetical protein